MADEPIQQNNRQPPAPGSAGKPTDAAAAQLKECEMQRDEYLNGWKRAAADFANYKKDEDKRFESGILHVQGGMVKELLPILDSFGFALATIEKDSSAGFVAGNSFGKSAPDFAASRSQEDSAIPKGSGESLRQDAAKNAGQSTDTDFRQQILKGILMIQNQFLEILKRQGVEKIPVARGDTFNPAVHEAMTEVEMPPDAQDKEQMAGKILEELVAGYTMNGKVLRAAKVKLAK